MPVDWKNAKGCATRGVTYYYDGDGRRVRKSSGTLYWYGTSPDPLQETDGSGSLTKEYIFFGGKRIAARDSSSNVQYHFADHLGSARVVTNASGAISQDCDYYPYGGSNCSPSSVNPYLFTGKERDSESGLDDFGARYYSSQYGRFMTPDEFPGGPVDLFGVDDPASQALPYADITDPQSLNKYSYTYNNPLRYTDPNGHCPWCIGAVVGAFAGAAIELGVEAYHGEDISLRQVGAAALGGAIAGGTLGLASEAGFAITIAAGAVGNTAGGVAERAANGEGISGSLSGKQMANDAAWGAAGAGAGKIAGEVDERIGGVKELDRVNAKLGEAKLGERHTNRLLRQQKALQESVEGSKVVGEQATETSVDAIHKSKTQPERCQQRGGDCAR